MKKKKTKSMIMNVMGATFVLKPMTQTHTTFDANEMSVKKKQTTIRKETSERPFLRPSGDQFEE